MIEVMSENGRNKALILQSMYNQKQMEVIQENMQKMQQLKHDMKNHLFVVKSLYVQKDQVACEEYYKDWMQESDEDDEGFVHSGNFVIDSIMNDKLSLMKKL